MGNGASQQATKLDIKTGFYTKSYNCSCLI